ncbi:hypothetical protein ACFWBF_31840 [Streptomyces sp. NPDC060028]|uniref:hypothetical protein n=1 Tax=Streptomyces sp. NPDC060028 TaxID=3347041 RepID=UPI003676DA58
MEHGQAIDEEREGKEPAGSGSGSGSGSAPDISAVSPSDQADITVRRHRARTPALITGAVLLGALAGVVAGCVIQYGHKPTPLPPLAQQKLPDPKPLAPDDSTSVRSINANRWHKSDDDLVKMLMEPPGETNIVFCGYESPDTFAADFYAKSDSGLDSLVRSGIRRIATLRWLESDRGLIEVRLLQFKSRSGAAGFQESQSLSMRTDSHGVNEGENLPDVPADFGHAWVHSDARGARAIARHGDIVVDISQVNTRGDVSQHDVVDLAKRQLERL